MIKYPKYKYFYAITDFFVIYLAFLLSEYIAEHFFSKNILADVEYPSTYILNFIFSFFFLFIFQNNNLYKINIFLTRSSQLVLIIKSFLYGGLILILFSFLLKFDIVLGSRTVAMTFLLLGVAFVSMLRIGILKPLYSYFTKRKIIRRNVLIVGAGNSGKILAEKLLFENFYGINIIGFIDNKIKKDEFVFGNIQSLGNLNELDKIYKTNNIDEVIISVDNVDYENLLKIIDYCNSLNLNVKLSSELFSIIPEKIVTETYSGMPLIDLSEKVNKDINIIFKRAFDLVVTIFTVILISPFMLVIALLIKLSSKGKVFYKQERIGKDGRKFNFYKFRSMVDSDNLDEEHKNKVREFILIGAKKGEELTKIIDEKRITSIGKFLRRTSLDELPQFFNVLKGDMSLVGPRPCLPYEYEVFDDWHKRRHSVLPGCTGVWQVTGRGSVSFKDSIILDLYYVNNITPWLDLQLIFKTIPVMVTGRGAK